MSARMVEVQISGRWLLLVPEHRANRPEWPWWEAARLSAMYHFIHESEVPHPLLVDVGSEGGDLSALYAMWGCDVVLIEPDPRAWPSIRATFERNFLAGRVVAAWSGFASNRDSSQGFPLDHPVGDGSVWPGCAEGDLTSVYGMLHVPDEDKAPHITIDTIGALQERPVDFITIDIEGAELIALRGADRVLREDRPIVFCSIHPEFMYAFFGIYEHQVHEYMRERDYASVHLATDHEQHWLFLPKERMWA